MLTNLEKAEKIVREFVEEPYRYSVKHEVPTFDVYIKWFAEFGDNWKAIAVEDLHRGLIYELSFESGKNDIVNIDVYESRANLVVTNLREYIGED